tara:strand:- start:2376 stop:2906 length:531 start_codon:yes stop_codon:yes gene_type:complete
MAHKEGHKVPYIQWKLRVDGDFETVDSDHWFKGKTAVVFSLPGAFTPTCSTQQLPGYEDRYQEFKDEGIDEIYCVSVNDSFVMNAWAKDLGIENVKLLPDGNGMFTKRMEQLVDKQNIGLGVRSWRYAMILKDGVIIKQWVEEGKTDNSSADPYSNTDPGTVINWIKGDYGQKKLK